MLFVLGASFAGTSPADSGTTSSSTSSGSISTGSTSTGSTSGSTTTQAAPSPTISSDQPDYAPGSTVLLTGSGWTTPGSVQIVVDDNAGNQWYSGTAQVASDGTISTSFQLETIAVSEYSVNATEQTSSGPISAVTTFTDASAGASIDQCANGSSTSSTTDCSGSGATDGGWQNGDLNSNNSHYREGDSVPFRIIFTGLTANTPYSVQLQWQATNSTQHAYDYLTTYNRTVTQANPCDTTNAPPAFSPSTCAGTPTTFPIPADPSLAAGCGFVGTQAAGLFTLWGGTITTLGSYGVTGCMPTSTTNNTITVNFTTGTGTTQAVLAWGGHVASVINWGQGNSASAITGSPYHMTIGACSASLGNCGDQDRAMKAKGGVFPEPGISTQVTPTSGQISIGGQITDTATMTGTTAQGSVTGSVDFSLCGPGGTTSCATGGTDEGTVPLVTGTPTTTSTATTSPITLTTLGTYCFRAEYTPDASAQYSPTLSSVTTNECVTVVPATPTQATSQSADGPLGSTTITDSDTVSGAFGTAGTNDNVTFNLYGPFPTQAAISCSGTPVDIVGPVTLSGGSGNTAGQTWKADTTAKPYTPTQAGYYAWQVTANFTGDADNTAPAQTPCTGTGSEIVHITLASPLISTSANPSSVTLGTAAPTLKDSATLSGGSNPTGTITFTLYGPGGTTVDTETANVTGDGTYPTPTGYTLPTSGTVVGTYQWVASYGGDSNNNPVASNKGDEPVVVSPASPTIATTAGETIVIGSGTKLTDSAVLSGAYNPTGSITFTLKNSSNVVVYTDVVSVSGNGTYTTAAGNHPGGYLPTAADSYTWSATYGGDNNNTTATDNGQNESQTVSPASPSISTVAGGTIVIGSGSKLTDTATLSGGYNPTGTITFTLTGPLSTVVYTDHVTVSGDGSYSTATGDNAGGYLPTATGTYTWSASYGGDNNNNSATDNGDNETEVVSPASPTISTTASPSTVTLGTSAVTLTDSAILSGSYNGTGSITFTLHGPAPGNALLDTETVPVSGDGTYTTPTGYTLPTTGTAIGTYTWSATYGGDGNNNPATDNGDNESVTVSPASPSISTTASPMTVTLGTTAPTLTDSATLSGGYNPTGTITFKLYDPNSVLVDTETATVSGNATYTTPTGYTLPTSSNVTGTYEWVASYSGDSNNNAVASTKGDEPVPVSPATPTIATVAGGSVVVGSGSKLTDTATLSGGYYPTGSITFTLKDPSSTVVYTDTVTVSGNGPYSTATGTNPGGYLPTVTGTYTWSATYSGDFNNSTATDDGQNESQAVTKAAPSISTTAGAAVVIGSGSAVSDSASLTGGDDPTGSITFTLKDPSSKVVYTDVATVSGDGTYTTAAGNNPGGYVPTVTGTYTWSATYGGDGNNSSATDNGDNETEAVSPASPAISTTAAPSTVTLGTTAVTLTDSAVLSGGYNPTGTITFTLHDPSDTLVDTETASVTGDGTYSTPTGYTLPTTGTVTGTYTWTATYNGDTNNNTATDDGESETTVVSPASPSISTTAAPSTVTLGTTAVTLTDSAVLSGGYNPTGTITFKLYDPSSKLVDTETATVSGDGTYSTPTGYTLPTTGTVPGTYTWTATYNGDTNNNTATDDGDSETMVVSPASPTISTTSNPTSVTLGTTAPTLKDSATLAGGYYPTGTITFTLYDPNNHVVDTETASVTGNGSYSTPTGYTLPTNATVTGTYQWVASYSGDTNNNAVASNKGDEPVPVSPASPSVVTTAGGSVVIGSGTKLTDSAVLSAGYFPTGTITFTLKDPSSATVYTDVVTVNGNATYTTATGTNPGGYLPTVTGTYTWSATYNGDGNNNKASDDGVGEGQAVTNASPSISTTAAPSTVTLGTSSVTLNDSATLSGGYSPTGTITFKLYNPSSVVVDTEMATVNNGNATYTTPNGYTLPTTGTVIGTYQWVASYGGDGNNKAVASNKGDEPVVVSPAKPAIQTTATNASGTSMSVSDSATLSGGYHPTGTITFKLYGPSTSPSCSTTAIYSTSVTVTGNATYGPVTATPTSPGTYYWVATYNGDTNNGTATEACGASGETSTVSPGVAKVVKTFFGSAPTGSQQVDFQLRSGASATAAGTTLETEMLNAANAGKVTFTTSLTPGATYEMCEVLGPLGPGWMTTLGPPLYSVYNPNGDDSTVCTNFTASAGQTQTFTINNTQPGGLAFTIGYWKNWSSCSGGKQAPILDQTLVKAVNATTNPPGGLVVSATTLGAGWPNFGPAYYLVLSQSFLKTNASGLCSAAMNLLSKSTANGKTKEASDPLFNMVSQLVGAELNLFSGAGANGNVATDVGKAVLLDGKYQFNGNGYTGKLSASDTTLANCLATALANYNSNQTVGAC